jgi:hypothetical protein
MARPLRIEYPEAAYPFATDSGTTPVLISSYRKPSILSQQARQDHQCSNLDVTISPPKSVIAIPIFADVKDFRSFGNYGIGQQLGCREREPEP